MVVRAIPIAATRSERLCRRKAPAATLVQHWTGPIPDPDRGNINHNACLQSNARGILKTDFLSVHRRFLGKRRDQFGRTEPSQLNIRALVGPVFTALGKPFT
jgi:hypothetical protein